MTPRTVHGPRRAFALLAAATLVAALLVLIALAAPRTAHAAGPLDGVCGELQAEAAAFDGRFGFVVLDLTDWTRCSYEADEVFITASLYKLVVLAEAYRQQEQGSFSFEEPIAVVRPPHPDDAEAGVRTVTMSSAEAARQMIQVSDNNTAEALRIRLDEPTVAALPARLGMPNTILGDDFTTTPSDIAHYFTQLNAGRLISSESDAAMLELLLGQQVNDRIPWFLPDDLAIAHKTGRLDRFAHDAGIVYAPGGPFLLVLLTEGAATQQQGYEAIRSLAELSYRAFAEPRPAAAAALPPFLDPAAHEAADVLIVAPARPLALAANPAPDATAASAQTQPAQSPAAEGAGAPALAAPLASGGAAWWETQSGRIGLLGALALVPLTLLALRQRRRPLPAEQALDAIDYRAERPVLARVMAGDSTMRMRASGKKAADAAEAVGSEVANAAEERVETGYVVPSARLQRLSGYFRAQLELLEEMSRDLESETAPLLELLSRQSRTVQQVLLNLDEQLGPLRAYNETEEANLEALEQRLEGDGMDLVARSFSDYVTQQHHRIAETRQRIDAQREPFEQLALDQRDSVELALARFDSDIEALEGNLIEQRRVLMRLLDAMRSDDFGEVTEFLAARQQALSDAASRGITDPVEIAARMHELRRARLDHADANAHLSHVLEGIEEADERLLHTGKQTAVRALEQPGTEPLSEDEGTPSRERTTA